MRKFVPILALLFGSCSWALDPAKTLTQYSHRVWGQEEGLFQPTIYSILQAHDGFLWLGTQDSLIRFDGTRFRELADANGNAVLHGSLIRALYQDKRDTLWVASIGNGVTAIRPDGSDRHYGPANVFCLDGGPNDSVWACTEHGLVRFENGQEQSVAVNGGARATCQATDGTRWIATLNSGLWHMTGASSMQYKNPLVPHDGGIDALACANDGSLWLGGGSGLVHIAGNSVRAFTAKDGLPDNTVSSLIEGPDGSLWIGTDDGISRYQNGELHVYRTRDGLSHSVVLALQFDREGSLWAGTKDGLDQFTDPKVTPYTQAEGMPSNEASALTEDRKGTLWIGTLDAGLTAFDGSKFRVIDRRNGLVSNQVLTLVTDSEGDIWAGTDQGVNRLHDGHVIGSYRDLSGKTVRTLFVDGTGVLWAGTDRGLDRFDGNRFRPSGLKAGSNGVVALGAGINRQLLISTDPERMPYLSDGKFGEFPIVGVSRLIDCYLRDPEHDEVWVGTLGSGLLRWHEGKLAHVHVKDGLYDNRIYSILDDGRGNLWMASSKGIFRVARAELDRFADGQIRTVVSMPFSTGQLRFECRAGVQPAAFRTHDGRLWFATTSGVVVVDPSRLQANAIPPPVRITSVLIDGQRFDPWAKLRLSPRERNLEIRYSGLSFINPEKVTFQYILDGYDRQWTDAGPRREAFFTKLPPGQYHFRVVARSADGLPSNQAAAVDFTVDPLLYQRGWFWPALVLLVGLTIASAWRLRMRQMRHRFGLVIAERSRIARELHDTLLQGLSGVTMQLQALWVRLPGSREKDTLRAIIDDAGICAAEARKSLWGLRADGAESSSFSDKLATLARSAAVEEDAGPALSLQIQPVSLDDRPETEFQLLRIAREAISNALEHSRAGRVGVILGLDARMLTMTIADDGIGFTPDRGLASVGRFGLVGMKERAEEIGASLEVTSAPGSGTQVSVRLPLS